MKNKKVNMGSKNLIRNNWFLKYKRDHNQSIFLHFYTITFNNLKVENHAIFDFQWILSIVKLGLKMWSFQS